MWSFHDDAGVHWFGLTLTNNTDFDIERIFSLDAPFQDETRFYTVSSQDRDSKPVAQTSTFNRDRQGYSVRIPAGHSESMLLSVDSHDFFVNAKLYDLPAYLESVTTRNLIVSLIIGALFCMLLFQVLLATESSEHVPLTLLILSAFSYELINLGYLHVLLGESANLFAPYKLQLHYLMLMAVTGFTSAFFGLRHDKALLGLFHILMGILGLMVIVSMLDPSFGRRALDYASGLPLILIGATMLLRFEHDRYSVVLYGLAWTPTLIGSILLGATIAGSINYHPTLPVSSEIGFALSLLLMVVLVTHRLDRRRRQQETDLMQTQRRYQLALEGSNDGIFEWDLRTGLVLASQRAHEIAGVEFQAGWRSQDVWQDVMPDSELDRITQMKDAMFVDDDLVRVETWCFDPRGEKVFLLLQGKLDRDNEKNPVRIIGSISDVSEQKHLEKRLRHDALHDFLTGLPNRTLLTDRMQRIAERLKRNPDARAALLFIDLDNFKAINDNLGHGFGDQVLVSLSERLLAFVRTTDTVARLGGDEFVILLEDMFSHREAKKFANRILATIQTPIEILDHHLLPSVSIGLTLIEDPKVSVETVLGDADIAMYTAKEQGKGRVVAFETTMRTMAAKRLEIDRALRSAIDNDELYLAYQPIFTLQDGEPQAIGVEALLRWSESEREDIAPSELLSVAEENGMIEEIGKWVVHAAARQLASWRTQGFPEDFYVNINLSAVHFENEEIVSIILNELDPLGVPRNSLRIEIVETAVIRHPEKALNVIKLLQSQGILVSIDDFGTGFSSLSYLHRFPFYALKIDRSFVMEIAESKATRDIVTAIVMLARRLDIKVVAEGIEDEAQLNFLHSIGCEMGQGFLLARPSAPGNLKEFFTLPGSAPGQHQHTAWDSQAIGTVDWLTDVPA
jgi:diguanylate cyclase (GGDEF)-like protein/PAS domain S-box-containing protein